LTSLASVGSGYPFQSRATLTYLAVDNTYQLGGSDDEREREQNAALIEQLERKKRLRRMAVPTDDKKVKERLRAYGEPITLFGEGVGLKRRAELIVAR
jgi:U4/U6 small nuclear ribonucleoprotein PRP4